jgi:ergothioneine biosynthesis protein EgtB
MEDLFASLDPRRRDALDLIELGLQHEQQHQELLLTDIRHILAANPSRPAYVARSAPTRRAEARSLEWIEIRGGLVEIGHPGGSFGFDNEFPRHRAWLDDFALSDRLITNGEFLTFVESGSYGRSELWLADGWDAVQRRGWSAPLGWEKIGDLWHETTLHGRAPLELDAPVAHVSHFEADAFARWRGARLPTEVEWEHAADTLELSSSIRDANLFDGTRFAPEPAPRNARPRLAQMFGDVWQWTSSAYLAYPGFAPWPGAIGEYNGKFMSGQIVLRGGSVATPRDHIRASYRNFFQPDKRWQFTGLRLARAR